MPPRPAPPPPPGEEQEQPDDPHRSPPPDEEERAAAAADPVPVLEPEPEAEEAEEDPPARRKAASPQGHHQLFRGWEGAHHWLPPAESCLGGLLFIPWAQTCSKAARRPRFIHRKPWQNVKNVSDLDQNVRNVRDPIRTWRAGREHTGIRGRPRTEP